MSAQRLRSKSLTIVHDFGPEYFITFNMYITSMKRPLITEVLPPPIQLAQLVVNAGAVAAVVDYLSESRGAVRLPGLMTLGYIAAHSENLAMAVIVSKVVHPRARF